MEVFAPDQLPVVFEITGSGNPFRGVRGKTVTF